MLIKKYQNGVPVTEDPATDPVKKKQKKLDKSSTLLSTIRRNKYETNENRETTNPETSKTGNTVIKNPKPARRLVKKAPKKRGCGCGKKK